MTLVLTRDLCVRRSPTAILGILLGDLLHHLPRSAEARPGRRASCVREDPAGGAVHHFLWDGNVASVAAVRPADEHGAGLPSLFLALPALLADCR